MKHRNLIFIYMLIFPVFIYTMCPDSSLQDEVETQVEIILSTLDNICTKLPTIDSKVDTLDSLTDELVEKVCTVGSKVDEFADELLVVQSTVEAIETTNIVIESTVDNIVINTESLESKLDVIESIVDISDLVIQVTDSKIDITLDQLITIESKVDIIDVSVDTITNKVCTIQSQIDIVDDNSITIINSLVTIESKVDIIDFEINIAQVNIDILQNDALTIESKIDILDSNLEIALQKICTTESKVEIIESNVDILATTVSNIDILATDRQVDFQETWTILAAIEDKLCVIESQEITILNQIDLIEATGFSSIFTVIEAIELKACTIDSKVDAINCDFDFGPTFTAIEEVELAIETACSQVDMLNTSLNTIVASRGAAIGTPIKFGDFTETFSITSGGRYFFSENITFSGNTDTNAIYIGVDNVHIDMCERLLTQAGTSSGVVGFRIASDLCNVSIENGSIPNFKGGGIVLDGGNQFVRLSNLMLVQIGKSADDASTQVSDAISIGANSKNIILENLMIQEAQDEGISLTTNSKLFIRSCQFNDTVNGDGGFFANGITQACLNNCIANNNSATGFRVQGGTNKHVVFKDCKAFCNTENGFRLFDIADSLINNCISESNVDGIELTSDLSATATNDTRNIIVNSSLSNNTSDGLHLDICFNCYIADNAAINNGSQSISETANNGPSSVLGNIGFKSSGSNYNTSNTVVNAFTVSQTAAFSPSTGPVRWHNIDGGP